MEKDAVEEKLERLQQDIATLGEIPLVSVSQHVNAESPGSEGASAFVEGPMNVAESKPAAHDIAENGDSDVGDSESGVSSMESFEGILRKENGRAPNENGVQENGVSDYHLENDGLDNNEHLDGGLSVSPDEYQRIRMNNSGETNEDITSSFDPVSLENDDNTRDLDSDSRAKSRESDDKSGDVSVPMLTVTDEDGTPAEVEYAENATESSLDIEGFSDQASEYFFDDFDVYYGDRPQKTVVDPDEASGGNRTAGEENERNVPESDSFTANESSSDPSHTDEAVGLLQNGSISDSQSNDLAKVTLPSEKTATDNELKDDLDISDVSELGDDILRHSTPSELIASTTTNVNTTPNLLERTSDSTEELVNGIETHSHHHFEDESNEDGSPKRDHIDTTPTKSHVPTSQTGTELGLESLGPNEEMDKLDNLLNINGDTSQNIGVEKPHDRIASILSERRKAEEAERLRFSESSVRDADYELFTSRPLDLVDRSSPLKDLNESENLLHENMSLDAFLVEVEKLLEKLRSIEELITTDMEDEDNVKDELAKHVVSSDMNSVIWVSSEHTPKTLS